MSSNDDYSYTAILSNAGSASSSKPSDDSWKAKKTTYDNQKTTNNFEDSMSQRSVSQNEVPQEAAPLRKVRL